MNSTATTHRGPVPIGPGRQRSRAHAASPSSRRPSPRLAPRTVIPAMGWPNRAPGVPVTGRPSFTGLANVMGEADAHPGVSLMGAGDRGMRSDLFGDSDAAFVGSLFGR
jgi:hypothetical protein